MKKKYLWSIFIVGLLASFILLAQRVLIDNQKEYSFSVDFLSLFNIHTDMGMNSQTFNKTLNELKKQGINTITLPNNNVFSLEQRGLLKLYKGSDLRSQMDTDSFKHEFTYLHILNNNKEIEKILAERFRDYSKETITHNGKKYLGFAINHNKLSNLSLPFLDSDVDFLVNQDFNIVFKVDNKFEDKVDLILKNIDSYINQYKETQFAIEFTENGYLSFGYEEEIELSALPNVTYLYREYFAQSEKQKGIEKIAVEKDFLRMHFISSLVYTNNHKNLDVISDRVVLAITERNINFISFQIPNVLDNFTAKDILMDFTSMLNETHTVLQNKGFNNVSFSNETYNFFLSESAINVLITFSFVGAMSFLFLFVHKYLKLHSSLHILGFIFVIIANLFDDFILFSLFLKVVSLLYVCFVPVYIFSVLYSKLCENKKNNFLKTVYVYLIINLSVLVFALLIPSLHFDEMYFKYIYSFSGITIASTLPIIFIVVLVCVPSVSKINFDLFLNFMKKPILIYQVILIGSALFVLLFYISRTGNAGSLLPFEKEFRDLMSSIFTTRPRTKEFLIAQPILLFCLFFFNKNYFIRFLLPIAAIAQISILNTFSHIHTAVYINLLRSLFGIGIGLLIGSILILISLVIVNVVKIFLNKIKKHSI